MQVICTSCTGLTATASSLGVHHLLSVAASSALALDNSTCSASKPQHFWIAYWPVAGYSVFCRLRYRPHHHCNEARVVWVAVRVTCTVSQAKKRRWVVHGSTTILWGTKRSWRGRTAARGPLPLRTIMCRPWGERWGWFRICGGEQPYRAMYCLNVGQDCLFMHSHAFFKITTPLLFIYCLLDDAINT
jgi:hypothetical protein